MDNASYVHEKPVTENDSVLTNSQGGRKRSTPNNRNHNGNNADKVGGASALSLSSSSLSPRDSGSSGSGDKMERGGATANDAVHLERRVGLVSGVALIVGTMIGSGIFVSPSDLLIRTRSPGLFLVTWVACGILSMLGALGYAELGTMITQSGAEYAYFMEAFGDLPGFLFCWVSTLLLKPSQLAIITLSFAKYTVEAFITECEPPTVVIKLVCAATIGSLAYAELGTLIPKSGGEYAYFMDAFGPLHGFWGPMPAFLFSWVTVLLLKPSSLAIISLSFAKYSLRPVMERIGFCGNLFESELAFKLLAVACMCLITFINCFSVKLATKVQNVFTAAKLIAVAIIVAGGLYMIGIGNTQYLAQGFRGSTTSYGDIATAFYSGLWAYDGWNNLNYVTEELKNPFVNLPRSILIGIPLVTVCYLMVNVAYLAVLSPDEMMASEAVAVTFGNRTLGVMAWLIPLAVCISTFGAANGTLFVGGRLCYVASREGHLVDILSYVNVKRLTPSPALLFNTLIAVAMIIPGDIASLINFFSFTAWIFYGGAMLALIVMRFTRKGAPRPYKVPIIIPFIVLIASIYLVIAPIIDEPKLEYLYASMFIAAGLIFYVPFVHYKLVLPGMGAITTFLQLLLEVAPSSVMPDE